MIWKDTFRAALVEVDPPRLLALIQQAEIAMTARSQSLPAISTDEVHAISDATWTLCILKSHALAETVETTECRESGNSYGHDWKIGRVLNTAG